jgi:hypothetical protein
LIHFFSQINNRNLHKHTDEIEKRKRKRKKSAKIDAKWMAVSEPPSDGQLPSHGSGWVIATQPWM